jgi:hypothetical protein
MWLELHAHSWYSKGTILGEESVDSPIQMVREARRKGLQGIAITDHDSFKSWESLKKLKFDDFIVIPGEEIYTKQGHLIALGISEEIKPKQDVLETIDKIHSQGGIAIAPHPFDIGKFGLRNYAKYADVIEIFNSSNMDRFSNFRAKKFAKKLNKPWVVGTDAHMKEVIGRGVIKLDADFDLDSILKAIKKGRILEVKTKYLTVREVTDWYIGRINRNYERAISHIDKNYNLVKKIIAKNLLKLSDRETFLSRGLVSFLSYSSLILSSTYSFLINFPKCLI